MTSSRASSEIARASPGFVIAVVAAVFAAVSLAFLWRVAATLPLRVVLDPNEGWNAYHAAAAMAGRGLYPDAKAYFVNNYPPLSFYIVGLLGRVVGDGIVAGRIISLLAFLFVAGGISGAARIMGCSVREAAIAALFFMAWLLIGSDYVGMNDPQLLGHAIAMGALLLILRAPGREIVAALLFVGALFVKHNLVAMPMAAALWLLLEDRVRAVRLIAAGMGFLFIALMLFRFAFGSSLLVHLASARLYAFTLLVENVRTWLLWAAVPLLILAALAVTHRNDRFMRFCLLYAVIALMVGVAFAGGAGVDMNVFFDADIALSLGIGLALNRYAARGTVWPAAMAAALVLPLALGLYQAYEPDWRDCAFWLRPMADEVQSTRGDIEFVRGRSGRALCETPSLCYWAGKDAEVDAFNVGQEYATGARSDDDLARLIRARAFSIMEFDTLSPFTLGPRVRAAVLASYRVDHTGDNGVFFVPR